MFNEMTMGQWTIMTVCAVVLDLIIGDPLAQIHPIVLIGRLIGFLTKKMNHGGARRFKGFVMWLVVVAGTMFCTAGLQYLTFLYLRPVFYLINVWLLAMTLAEKSLKQSVLDVADALHQNIEEARIKVGYLVGRDTTKLDADEIIRATVETTAENTIDGVLAPYFYMLIGIGVSYFVPFLNPTVFALVYKAVNTMDSMVGYKQEPFTDFGYYPAKIDDVFNYLPARLGSYMMMIGGALLGYDAGNALRIYQRDRWNHKSPNAGHPESVVAGLLHIRLGGDNVYFGEVVHKPTIGDADYPLAVSDIGQASTIMTTSEIVMVIVSTALFLAIGYAVGA